MKKLFVIGVLALATVSFRSASAQSAASTSSQPDTTTASGSNSAASVVASAPINSDDLDRVASATPAKPASEKPAGPEALIDLNRVMKEAAGFNEQVSALKDRIRKFDQECREQQSKLTSLQVELKAASEASLRKQLEDELADGKAKLQSQIAETKKQFMADEAKIYSEVYEQIRAVTADYAKEHGIRRVTRSQSVARAEDKVEANDRTAMLQRINRPIIYLEGDSESPTDITDAIMQRLMATGHVQ